MHRSLVLWGIVIATVATALAARVLHQRALTTVRSTEPTSRPTEPDAATALHDYVSYPFVELDEINNGPAKIISMAPSITETCCALGLLDHLAGRTRWGIFPPQVKKVPDVGAIIDPNLELIETIDPDIVFISQNAPRVRELFDQLHIPYEAVTDDSYDGVFTAIRRIGNRTGRPRTAAHLIHSLTNDVAAIVETAKARAPKRVILVIDAMPIPPAPMFVAGPNVFLSRLLEMLGHRNAAEGLVTGKSGELSLEQIVAINPDVILETRADPDEATMTELYTAWSQIGDITAIRNRAVRSYGSKANLVPSPRMNIVLYDMAQALAEWR